MSREIRPILAMAAVVTFLVLAVIALRPGTTETVVHPRVDLPPPRPYPAICAAWMGVVSMVLAGLRLRLRIESWRSQ
jgi:hypothetical protein